MKDSNLIFLKLRRSERDPDPFRLPVGFAVVSVILSIVGLLGLAWMWLQ